MGLVGGKHPAIGSLLEVNAIDDKTEEIGGFGGWGVTLAPYVAAKRAEAFEL